MFKIWNYFTNHKSQFVAVVMMVGISFFSLQSSRASALAGDELYGELTNVQRTANGLAPFAWSLTLANAATLKAQDMCANNYWAHTSPTGTTGWTFMSQAGYRYAVAGENLARDFTDPGMVVAAWMASPGHRANILKSAYLDIGVASMQCTIEGVYTTVVVAHYGATYDASPKPVQPVTKPETKPQPQAAQPIAEATKTVLSQQFTDATPPPTTPRSTKIKLALELEDIPTQNFWQRLLYQQPTTLVNQLGLVISERRVLGRLYQEQ